MVGTGGEQAHVAWSRLATALCLAVACGGETGGAVDRAGSAGSGGADAQGSGGAGGHGTGGVGQGGAGATAAGGASGGAPSPTVRPVAIGTPTPVDCGTGGCTAQTIATPTNSAGQLSVYGDYVYWVERQGNRVSRAHRSGSTGAEVIADLDAPISIEADATGVHVAAGLTDGVAVRIAHDGSSMETLAAVEAPFGIALAPEVALLVDASGVATVPRAGGSLTPLIAAEAIYIWTDWRTAFASTRDGELLSVPLTGGASSVVGGYDVEDMASDVEYLYVLSTSASSNVELVRHPLTGGPGELVIDGTAFGNELGWSLAVDTTDLYVATNGGLYRVPVASESPLPASAAARLLTSIDLGSIAVDDDAIYFAGESPYMIGRIDK